MQVSESADHFDVRAKTKIWYLRSAIQTLSEEFRTIDLGEKLILSL